MIRDTLTTLGMTAILIFGITIGTMSACHDNGPRYAPANLARATRPGDEPAGD